MSYADGALLDRLASQAPSADPLLVYAASERVRSTEVADAAILFRGPSEWLFEHFGLTPARIAERIWEWRS